MPAEDPRSAAKSSPTPPRDFAGAGQCLAPRAPDGDASFRAALAVLALLGVILSAYVFFLPYNTIADEEEYLDEVFSAAAGAPAGWEIRHLLYPILLSPLVTAAKAVGVDVTNLALVARLGNWLMWWIGMFSAFGLARRLFDRETAWLAVVLIGFNWVWMLSSKRLMMDMPSAVWFLLALHFFVLRTRFGLAALAAGIACAALATVTKFQMGPLAALYGAFVIADRFREGKARDAAALISIGILIVFAIGLVDRLTYGSWFGSLFAFAQYIFGNAQAFADKYGACGDALYYLRNAKDVFSYFVWPLALLGIGGLVVRHRSADDLLMVICLGGYLLLVHFVCHKQSRYLVAILPQLSILAAAAYVYGVRLLRRQFGRLGRQAVTAAAVGGIGLIIVSLAPRNEVREILALRESCADFVYRSMPLVPTGSRVMLAVPCGMPTFYLGKVEPVVGDLGFNDYTRKAELEKFRSALSDVDAAFVEPDNPLGNALRADWKPDSYAVHRSPGGRYELYVRFRDPRQRIEE